MREIDAKIGVVKKKIEELEDQIAEWKKVPDPGIDVISVDDCMCPDCTCGYVGCFGLFVCKRCNGTGKIAGIRKSVIKHHWWYVTYTTRIYNDEQKIKHLETELKWLLYERELLDSDKMEVKA